MWFASYLRDRKQSVKVGGFVSEFVVTNIAVSRGSIFGPILFLLFINDLPNASSMSNIYSLTIPFCHFPILIAMY